MTKNVQFVNDKPVNYTDQETLDSTLAIFERLMTVLHPFMPFVTEEVWHQLRDRAEGEDCVVSTYPKAVSFDKNAICLLYTSPSPRDS